MRLLTTFILLTICLTAIGQTILTKKEGGFRIDTLIQPILGRMQKTPPDVSYGNIDTEIKYTHSTGNSIIIQNSGPQGGIGFTDDSGIRFGHRLFWTRVINEANTPLELTITFPADSFALPGKDSYMKVFLHPDGFTQESKTLTNGRKATDFAGKLFWDTTLCKFHCRNLVLRCSFCFINSVRSRVKILQQVALVMADGSFEKRSYLATQYAPHVI